MRNSPQHKLAKWLVEKLEPVRNSMIKYSAKDTFEIIDMLRDLNIADAHLASMDVESLFTNVPVDETINSIFEHIQFNNLNLGLPHREVKQLLEICTKNVTYRFQGHYFRQVDGVAMGSPLGPLMADVFMATLEASFRMSSRKQFCIGAMWMTLW